MVVILAIAACWAALQREYLRGVLLIYGRPQAMLRADVINVAVLLVGALIAVYGPKPAVVWAVAALIASALSGMAAARRSLAQDPGFATGDAAPFWREMRPLAVWATIGAMTYWIYNQSYNYVLASRIDLTAVADVNAARLLLMPTIVLTVGVKTLLVPTAASWLAESSVGRLIRKLLLFATGIALIDVVYCIGLWIFRDAASHDLMHKNIANRDMLLILWALLSLIALYRDLLQTGLFALRKFRSLAGVTALSAAASRPSCGWGSRTGVLQQRSSARLRESPSTWPVSSCCWPSRTGTSAPTVPLPRDETAAHGSCPGRRSGRRGDRLRARSRNRAGGA